MLLTLDEPFKTGELRLGELEEIETGGPIFRNYSNWGFDENFPSFSFGG